jgi:hypothetical protein
VPSRPREQFLPAVAGQHHARGPLVRGGHEHGPRPAAFERGDVQTVLVDRDGHGRHAGGGRLFGGRADGAGVLDGERVDAVGGECSQYQSQGLRMPVQMTSRSAVASTARTRRR